MMTTSAKNEYKRVLIKLSGEALGGAGQFGISEKECLKTAKALQSMHTAGLEVGVVIGGGNIFRGNKR
jgi:uridylate kinase